MYLSNIFIVSYFLQLFICPSTKCPHGQGEGVVKLKEGRRAKREGGVENWEKCEHILYG